MSDKKRVKMTKKNGKVMAEANVLSEHVATWEAKGWKKAAATQQTAEGGK